MTEGTLLRSALEKATNRGRMDGSGGKLLALKSLPQRMTVQ